MSITQGDNSRAAKRDYIENQTNHYYTVEKKDFDSKYKIIHIIYLGSHDIKKDIKEYILLSNERDLDLVVISKHLSELEIREMLDYEHKFYEQDEKLLLIKKINEEKEYLLPIVQQIEKQKDIFFEKHYFDTTNFKKIQKLHAKEKNRYLKRTKNVLLTFEEFKKEIENKSAMLNMIKVLKSLNEPLTDEYIDFLNDYIYSLVDMITTLCVYKLRFFAIEQIATINSLVKELKNQFTDIIHIQPPKKNYNTSNLSEELNKVEKMINCLQLLIQAESDCIYNKSIYKNIFQLSNL
ncbi:MAG: hypothetical protein PHS65_04720 [Arcobacteraceae bacterium]|nr:hypothetical protein [Arcobacteraceae bacterium]